MDQLQYRQPVWWGDFDFPIGQGRTWTLGGLTLDISRQPQEWHLRLHRADEQSEHNQDWQQKAGSGLAEIAGVDFRRYMFQHTGPGLRLLPRLADRSVVVRPLSPLFIPAGQETTLYVSTPVWVAAYVNGSSEPLLDVPVVIPRDTWFGPNPVVGQLCYASKISGRTDFSQLPIRAFRAITPVHVRNQGHAAMPIERINIPTPFLPVYGAESGRLWTPTLVIVRHGASLRLNVRIEDGISTQAGHVAQLTPARHGPDEHALIRVFENFFD